MTERHLRGWVKTEPDPRNENYRVLGLLGSAVRISSREWQPGPVLDQGRTPHCVAFGSDGWLACDPVVNDAVNPDDLYAACQAIDGIPMPHDGTTVHAAMKVLRERNYISNYYWARTEAEVRAWVSSKGPVIIGVDWPQTYFHPTPAGYLHWSDQIAGGHCVLLCGYDARRKAYRLQNSWGTGWGQQGFAWLRVGHLSKLLAMGGEAATALEIAL